MGRTAAPTRSVVGAESGITKMQGDARGGDYANDPFSHADTYTALELTTAILAALYQRERTGAGQSIDVSMAETMLFVNDHLNAELWDGPEDPQSIRNFAPGDYIVFQTADGDSVLVSGHPAERGTFELLPAGVRASSTSPTTPASSTSPAARRNIDALRELLLEAAATIPDAATFEEPLRAHHLAVGRLRSARDLADSEWAAARGAIAEVSDRGGGTIRIPNPPWHFSDGRRRRARRPALPRRGQPGRARRAARLRRRHHRRPRGRRGAVEPGAIIARVTPVVPDRRR